MNITIFKCPASEILAIDIFPGSQPPFVLPFLALYAMDRKDEINHPRIKDPELMALSRRDLRYHPKRSEIYAKMGIELGTSYYDLALSQGKDFARFY